MELGLDCALQSTEEMREGVGLIRSRLGKNSQGFAKGPRPRRCQRCPEERRTERPHPKLAIREQRRRLFTLGLREQPGTMMST